MIRTNMADQDPMRAYWQRLPPEEARRQARELLRQKGVRRPFPFRTLLLVLLMLAIGTVTVIYLWAWILAFI